MNKGVADFAEAVRYGKNSVFLVTGNIYDIIPLGKDVFPNVIEFITSSTEVKCRQCLTYDLFKGIQLLRGDENKVLKDMGLSKLDNKEKDSSAEMIEAFKKAKAGGNSSKFPVNPLEAFYCLDQLFENTEEKTLIVIEFIDSLTPAAVQNLNRQMERVLSIAITKWARSDKIKKKGHMIVLLARSETSVSEEILDRCFEVSRFRVAKPDEEQRADYFESSIGVSRELSSLFSKASAGLSFRELAKMKDIFTGKIDKNAVLAQIFAVKKKVLNDEYSDLMEVMETRNGFESIGGLEKPIAKLKRVSERMREGKWSLVPMGVLFMGPPGTGKTVTAEALAKEAGVNFVRPKDIKSMWVGESERRMTMFLDAVKDLAPVVIFIDEFDQSQPQRGGFDGDSGVSKNLFKKMLEVMSDTAFRGKILFILATNRPDLIDPAMKRPGRCDLRIPFLRPKDRELQLICKAAFKQHPDMRTDMADWSKFTKRCAGYTGADMVEVVRRAWEFANDAGREKIAEKDMDLACTDYRPQVTDKNTVCLMTLMAIRECSYNSLLPDGYEAEARECAKALGLDDSQGNDVKSIFNKLPNQN